MIFQKQLNTEQTNFNKWLLTQIPMNLFYHQYKTWDQTPIRLSQYQYHIMCNLHHSKPGAQVLKKILMEISWRADVQRDYPPRHLNV